MGREVAKLLAADGYIVGMAARRIALLEEVQREIPTQTYIAQIDASNPYEAAEKLNAMIEQMGGLDLLILTVSGFYDADFSSNDWTQALPVLNKELMA
jgi:short-subunit dehydrogenase